VDVRFDFIVNGQEMPAGSYIVQVSDDRVLIKRSQGSAGTEVPEEIRSRLEALKLEAWPIQAPAKPN